MFNHHLPLLVRGIDLVNGKVTNEQILYGSKTFVRRERKLIRETERKVHETRTCVLGILCSQ